MNLFEKIFNYQLISRLEESGSYTLTSHERAWLKTMLAHPAADEAFMPETLRKLRAVLESEPTLGLSDHVVQKARSAERQVYHPLLRPLRRIIMNGSGIRLTFRLKNGGVYTGHYGFPYRLEYSMVKREWYLLWHHMRHQSFMSTRLANIVDVHEEAIAPDRSAALPAQISAQLEGRKETAIIEVVRLYNQELSRILYAFSCFEKEVDYDGDSDTYRIKLTFLGDESEYVLSKIRFLGKRVRVAEGARLQRRMLESTSKALARYAAETQ
ncbi:WYL domain-containing protein [Paenibacillus mendelii]|uniref:WYL domain-containing protein n=1 Tax=Paenibacillus mendelii TaxID=206163 RepID=A0ABV6JNK2_9BACL|nr:WYL domain-containing protein [Paenibacillus mendelii]MCQ6563088.1 WYL domain-containing protein [Paenibacillus mendelii]